MSIELVMLSTHLIFCHPLLLPSVFPSIRVFSNEPALHWSFSIIPSNEYSGLISFRIDCFDLLTSKRLSRVFSSITVWKHQFFSTQASLWTNSHFHIWLLEKPEFWLYRPLLAKWYLFFHYLTFKLLSISPCYHLTICWTWNCVGTTLDLTEWEGPGIWILRGSWLFS